MKNRGPWWNLVPFARLLIPLVGGILLYRYGWFRTALYCLFPAGLAVGTVRLLPIYVQFRLRFLLGFWLNLMLVTSGLGLMHLKDLKNSTNWFGHRTYNYLLLKTVGEPRLNRDRQSVLAEVIYLRQESKWMPAKGKILLNLPAESGPLAEGSLLGSSKQPQEVENSPNGKFKAFMAQQQVFHQLWLKNTEMDLLNRENPHKTAIYKFRENILGVLEKNLRGSERALAKALLVGYRTELDKELVTAYSNTGVIHIIAISGMHLGIIYALLIMLLKPLAKGLTGRILVNIMIAGALWIFTFICGASPSVTRSAVMFTCLLLGESIGAENNTGNAVAGSAFLLLCYDPLLLWDIGFQLSYAAVASLLIYNRSIVQLAAPENGILIMAWNGIATSLAAQILTTPLVLVQFHQFPLLFILSNFVAVPVSSIILILLILVIILQFLPAVSMVLATLAAWSIRFMNLQVERIASVKFAVWSDIQWTWLDLVMAYLFILTLTRYLGLKGGRQLILFLLTILTWVATSKYSSR